MDIPEKHQAFCKEVAALARKHGLRKFAGSYEPGFGDTDWRDTITFTWEEGRHGADANKIFISSQVYVHGKIDGPD